MRVKSGIVTRKRRKRLLNQTEGYFGSKHTLFRTAHEQWMNSQHYAFQGRKKRKGDFRKIWTIRLNSAVRTSDLNYSTFINTLKTKNIIINRKIMSQLAIENQPEFENILNFLKQ